MGYYMLGLRLDPLYSTTERHLKEFLGLKFWDVVMDSISNSNHARFSVDNSLKNLISCLTNSESGGADIIASPANVCIHFPTPTQLCSILRLGWCAMTRFAPPVLIVLRVLHR